MNSRKREREQRAGEKEVERDEENKGNGGKRRTETGTGGKQLCLIRDIAARVTQAIGNGAGLGWDALA